MSELEEMFKKAPKSSTSSSSGKKPAIEIAGVSMDKKEDMTVDLKRGHNANFVATVEGKTAAAAITAINSKISQFLSEQKDLKGRNSGTGSNFGLHGRHLTAKQSKERLYKRAANKVEKDRAVETLKKILIKNGSKTQQYWDVFNVVCDYSKFFALDFKTNDQIIEKALIRSKENGYRPDFFLQRFEAFATDYMEYLLPVIAACKAQGVDEKFMSWGIIQEVFREELGDATKVAFMNNDSGDHSFRFFYSKVAFYGLQFKTASFMFERIILSTIKVTTFLKALGIPITLDNPNVTVETAKKQCEPFAEALRSKRSPQEALEEGLSKKESRETMSLDSFSFFVAGIAPYAIMQNWEYKKGYNDPSMIKACHGKVVWSFQLIRKAFNALTGSNIEYKATKFVELRPVVYEMWRPIFVYARVAKGFFFPQANYAINSAIELDMSDVAANEEVDDDLKDIEFILNANP